jgi:hypothetical protein
MLPVPRILQARLGPIAARTAGGRPRPAAATKPSTLQLLACCSSLLRIGDEASHAKVPCV